MHFITYAQLHRDVTAFAADLPSDLVGIVGVPRSGMLAATLLGLHCHLPVADLQHFAYSGRFWACGSRLPEASTYLAGGTVLILDDSCYRGSALAQTKAVIARSSEAKRFELIYGTMYLDPGCEQRPDIFYRFVDAPRYFEWNLMQHVALKRAMVDIDGVVCRDPTVPDDDGPQYEAAIRNAIPFHIPRCHVGAFATMRLERWRDHTAAWLRDQKISYDELLMCSADSARRRRISIVDYGAHKGKLFAARPNLHYFIESDPSQAPSIARESGKPVICLGDGKVY